MENLLNPYDKECLKIAILKHEETFREQVYELHRLYRIQKLLMKDIAKNETQKNNPHVATCRRPEAGLCLDRERPPEGDPSDLELTLGPKSYYEKKIKAAGPDPASDRKWGPEMPGNQDRLNSPPWLFQALSLNIT